MAEKKGHKEILTGVQMWIWVGIWGWLNLESKVGGPRNQDRKAGVLGESGLGVRAPPQEGQELAGD